jgi:hypothetical protein
MVCLYDLWQGFQIATLGPHVAHEIIITFPPLKRKGAHLVKKKKKTLQKVLTKYSE